jgi:hypothetical protein
MSPSGRRKLFRRLADDLREFRNVEAYAISALAVGLTIFTIVGNPSAQLFNTVTLACLAFLVFSTTTGQRAARQAGGLAEVLRDRDSYATFEQLLDGATELWMYAPSGVNVLRRHGGDIKRWLAAGGRARFVVHDPAAGALDTLATQLDEDNDFGNDLTASLDSLDKLAGTGRLEYRLLSLNPGFSLVVVNPRQRGGRLIVEFHGFQDESISDRMHVEVRRSESTHWFDYWAGRFEAIWAAARDPGVAGTGDGGGVKLARPAPSRDREAKTE